MSDNCDYTTIDISIIIYLVFDWHTLANLAKSIGPCIKIYGAILIVT